MTQPTRSRKRNASGLSLLELLIALTVLAIGLLGLLAMQTQALNGSRHGKHVTEASRFAEEQMAFLQRQPWAAIPLTNWTAPRTANAVVGGTGPTFAQAYAISFRVQAGPDPNLRRLDVRITWTTPDAPPGAPVNTYNVSSVRRNDT